MQTFMLDTVNQFGYLGIFLLIFIESVFPPIPSEAVLLFGGALTTTTAMNIPGTILAATAGSLSGALVLYALGSIFQANRLKILFAGKVGKMLHLKPEYVDKSIAWFVKYQYKAVLICRCIPLVRSLISIPAGCAAMNIWQFLLLTTIGSTLWNTLLITVGAWLGTAWKKATPYFDKYTYFAIAILGILVLLYITFYLIKKKKK